VILRRAAQGRDAIRAAMQQPTRRLSATLSDPNGGGSLQSETEGLRVEM
jgi:hypothetical protein